MGVGAGAGVVVGAGGGVDFGTRVVAGTGVRTATSNVVGMSAVGAGVGIAAWIAASAVASRVGDCWQAINKAAKVTRKTGMTRCIDRL